MYDFLIVGGGLFGAVFAEQCLRKKKKVLVIDKRNHIGGNCYTKNIDNIIVHKYGPHIFHTNNKNIWNYVNQFSKFNNFTLRTKVNYRNNIYSFPINLMTMYQLWGITNPDEAKEKIDSLRYKIKNPKNLEEWILSQVGEEIYEKFIYGYTKKQWKIEPKLLPKSIIQRLPIRFIFDDNYFNDAYQGIPEEGYTNLIQNMLCGADVELETDYFKNRSYWDTKSKNVVFTGRIDEFYEYIYGELNYRTLKFEEKRYNKKDYQGNAIINYTDYLVPYTRIIEHKYFNNIDSDNTIITKEFPDNWEKDSIPYYPINTEENNNIYEKYKNIKTKTIFGGRLAEYKYYDMHQIIGSALNLSKKILY